ncbi:hypothetical protein ANO11243_058960 [Dothideomycetidae sp. 11243]|nr:hypothetical protein ANO11243_058960 [fungal sp. No.11243]
MTTTPSSAATPVPFPHGPPPPYSAATQAAYPPALVKTASQFADTALKPQEGRDVPSSFPANKSLPSLSEALGVERNVPYSSESVPALTQTTQPRPVSAARDSPPRRPGGNPSPPHVPQSYVPQTTTYPASSEGATRYAIVETSDYRRRDYAEPATSSYQHRSPVFAAQPQREVPTTSDSSRQFEGAPGGSQPPSQFAFGYTPSSAPPFQSTAPARTNGSTPSYQGSMGPPAPEAAQSWRPGPHGPPSSVPQPSRASHAYSDSVKRHLDLYEFELALNEIAEHGTIMADFSRQYGARLHQVQRSGVVPGTLPAITEVEDLMNKSRQAHEALGRMREVLVAQQAAYFQQAQEQHNRLDLDSKRNDSVHQQDESKLGGFAGSEPKKRRGRNAAPGRCHSCNRAETPEWRRGPDGARTLCNACGLHYAKLTRKAGANKAPTAGSNLRPKSEEDGTDI